MEKILQHNGVKMLYTVEGEGQPVVLMHGWGCTHDTVKSIADVCLKSHRVYNVDFPGFGASTEPTGPEVWGVEEYTRIIEKLVEAEGIENPVLIGHSFGGRVAIVYASRNKVDKVVLVDAAGVKPRRKLNYYIKVYSFKLSKRWYKLVYGKEGGMRRIEKMRNKRGSSDYANSTPMMKAILSKVVNEDLCHLMPKIQAPTLLIWGKNDTATPLADAKKMEKLIPDAGLVAFDDCGHYSFLDNRPGFAAVLNSFIN